MEYDEPVELPPHTRYVLDVPQARASLSHTWLQIGRQRCSTWFIEAQHGDPDETRRLRMQLVRFHTERECLKCMLFHIKYGGRIDLSRDSPISESVQEYLGNTLRVIQRPKRHGLDQSAMFRVASEALGVAFEGENASLGVMRRQVSARVDGYIRQAQNTATVINNIQGNVMNTNIQLGTVTVSGDFNVVTAENIQSSFNKAANSDVNAVLREKLQ